MQITDTKTSYAVQKKTQELPACTVGAVVLERYRRKHSFFKWLYLSNQA
jgi:hypothetical protein